MLFGSACAACGRVGPSPCAACRRTLAPPLLRDAPRGVDRFAVGFAYEGAGRELVATLKYRNRRSSIPWMTGVLVELVRSFGDQPALVTWVPTTRSRRSARGFDQSRLLARRLAWRLGVPCRSVLVRVAGPPQTGRPAAARRHGPRFEPAARSRSRRAGGHGPVVIIDDVVTTGATLAAAARAVREILEPTEVWAVALARTPLKAAPRGAEC